MDPVMTLNEAHQSNKMENKESINPKNAWLPPQSVGPQPSEAVIQVHLFTFSLAPNLKSNQLRFAPPCWYEALS